MNENYRYQFFVTKSLKLIIALVWYGIKTMIFLNSNDYRSTEYEELKVKVESILDEKVF